MNVSVSTSRMPGHRGRRTRAAAIGVTVCLAATLVACGPANGSSSSSGPGGSGTVGVSLILKTLTNPYFVSMEKAARAQAAKDDVRLTVAAGNNDGDTLTQITAIENAISRGDRGILITTNGDAVNAALKRARQAGLFVIALDTATNPPGIADLTYATDNEQAGRLAGQYAAAALDGRPAVVAMLDLFDNQVVSVDIARDHGFLKGMGIDPGSSTENGKEARTGTYTGGKGGTYTIACHQATQGAVDGGRTAMENCLSANPGINVVYAINERAGEGAYKALKAAGKEKNAAIHTIDGSCAGLRNVAGGTFATDAVQYPGRMAALGVSSVAQLGRGGARPGAAGGKTFHDTGTALAAARPVGGLTVQSPSQAASACWGG
ncbi:sugar ABC transporter [Streptomyces mashuensis]|uniref:Sugar ABC transporter n=1 Tax=Streptomyces mashuensis TaxID=33904 RepID=A0A919BAB5_9ACTN|nr:substrate-binding domain-containing protein [Streptomyces mashuensis]GHF71544.1 sugar ABC transporter [Streptomyces mashuensis]